MAATRWGSLHTWWQSIGITDEKIGRTLGLFVRSTGKGLGAIGAVIVYFGIWIAAADSAGWVIGIALGWIPAAILAAISYAVLRYMWWLVLLIGIYLFRHQA
jgi:hypothetical protein